MESLIRHIAEALVDHPEEIDINIIEEDDHTMKINLKVAESDMGKVIGKHGRVAKSIRAILKAISMKQNKSIYLEIG